MQSHYEKKMEQVEFRKAMAVESLLLEATETICQRMEELQMSRAELARRLGKSRAAVTKMLEGNANLTIRTLAEVLFELNGELSFGVRPFGTPITVTSVAQRSSETLNGRAGRVFRMELPVQRAGQPVFQIEDEVLRQEIEETKDREDLDENRPGYAA
jgi:transcriptional regulator with XRE-family HTH domain